MLAVLADMSYMMLASKEADMSDGKHGPGNDEEKSLARLGGEARAAKLSSEEKSAIAKKGAEARWANAKGLPKETHTGILKLGDGIACSVLDNKMRVLSANGVTRALGSGAKGRTWLADGSGVVPSFLAAANVRPF